MNSLFLHKKSKVKSVFRTLIALSVPTITEQIFSTLLQYVDTAMVGYLGERATSAVSITTTVNWLIGSISSAVSVAVLAMISQAYGSGNKKLVKNISAQAFIITCAVGAVLGIVSVILSPHIPKMMGAEESIQKDASIYFFIISLPMIFRVSATVLGSALRAVQNTKTPMFVSIFENIINLLLNYIFIYTLNLGVTGAGIGSAISYTFSGILMFIVYRKNEWLHWKIKKLHTDFNILKKCIKIGFPVLCTSVTSCMGYVIFAALVSGMGTTIFAAHSIAVTAETIFYIPGYGLRTATSTLVGAAKGEKNSEKFNIICKLSIIITISMMILSGILLFFVSYPLMKFFTNSLNAAFIGSQMLRIVAFSEPFFGLMIVMEGIFYGLGHTKYAFFVETFCMWGIRILFTFICVKIWGLNLMAVWYCMIADNICKALLLALPVIIKPLREKIMNVN